MTVIISSGHWQERIGEGEKDVFYGVWSETAKDEEIICKEKSVILCSIIFIIISLFCLYAVILSEIPQSSNTNYFFVA